MTDFTDGQLEWAARVVCAIDGIDADHPSLHLRDMPTPRWTFKLRAARRLLAELERQGVKAMSFEDGRQVGFVDWKERFYHSPICPDADHG